MKCEDSGGGTVNGACIVCAAELPGEWNANKRRVFDPDGICPTVLGAAYKDPVKVVVRR